MRRFILIIMFFICWANLNAQRITVKMTGSVSVCPLSTNSYTLPDIIIDEGKVDNFKSEGGSYTSQDVVIKLPSGYTFASDAPIIQVLSDTDNGGGNDITVYSTPYTIFSSSSKIAISIYDKNPSSGPSTNITITKKDRIKISGLKLATTGSVPGNIEVDLSTPNSGLQTDGSYVRTSDNGNITDIQVGIINITSPPPISFRYYTKKVTQGAEIFDCLYDANACSGGGGCESNNTEQVITPCFATKILKSAITILATGCGICQDCYSCQGTGTYEPDTETLELITGTVCPGTEVYIKVAINGETNLSDGYNRNITVKTGTPGTIVSTPCPDGGTGCFISTTLNHNSELEATVLDTMDPLSCQYTYPNSPAVEKPPIQNIPTGVLRAKDVSYNVPLRIDPNSIEPDSILVFGNFESIEFKFKNGNIDIPKTDYNFNGNAAFIQDVSSEAWFLNPNGLNLDIVYTVGFRDLRCGNTLKYFKFKLFDNSPKQLVGISNGGVCKDLALSSPSGDIKIGWIGQGAVGYLSCIEDDPAGGKDYIDGSLKTSYKTTKGVESGFYIKRNAINASSGTPSTPETFKVIITYYVCPDGFNPATNTIGGCGSSTVPSTCIKKTIEERITISDPAPEQITILGLDPIKSAYCENAPSITLLGTPTNAESGALKQFSIQELTPALVPTGPDRPLTTTTTLEFRAFNTGEDAANSPNILVPGKIYRVSYTYTNKYGCGKTVTHDISVEKLPNPIDPVVTPTTRMFCLNSTIPTSIKIPGYETSIIRWYSATGSFLYEDTGGSNTGFDPQINSAISADYQYQVSVVSASSEKCESNKVSFNISVGEPIMPKFSFTRVCEGTQVEFTNESNLPNPAAPDRNQVESHNWDFGDPASGVNNTSTLENPMHIYQTPGIYTVRYTIVTKAGCSNFTERRVIVHKEAVFQDNMYFEDFNGNNISWTSSSDTELLNGVSKNSSWRIMTLEGNNKAFVTNNPANLPNPTDGSIVNYNNSEYSWIESPCFDLTKLTYPLMNITLSYDTDNRSDGAFVIYTIDNGATWTKLGSLGEIGKVGAEWYNEQNIIGLPSIADPTPSLGYPTDLDQQRKGWSGNSEKFVEAKISLQEVMTKIGNDNTKRVRFRIVFASNADNTAGKSFSGIKIDKVVILDKNHKVFLEHFTNTTDKQLQDRTWIEYMEPSIDKSDVVHVQYHTTFPTGDLLGQDSRPESNARSLHYAISQPPYTVVDGKMEPGKILYKVWKPTSSPEAYNYYLQRSLVAATFSIGAPTFTGGTAGNPLGVSVNISRTNAPSDKTSAVVAHMMIVENDVNGNKNVVRRMLPSPAGTRIENFLAATSGTSHTLQGTWKPSRSAPTNTYSLVVFVADEQTKEVYQAEIFPINQNVDARTSEKLVTMDAEEINLYPNPTSADVTVVLPETPTGKVTWKMFDALGREVEGGSGTTDNALFRVTTQNCNKGIYIIEISTSEWKVRKSVSVIK